MVPGPVHRIRRSDDPELYHLSLLLGGTGTGSWDRENVYRPSDVGCARST
ncbi:hypothetical protein [Streptomyces sp. NPDC048527]